MRASFGLPVLHEFDERLRLMHIPVTGQINEFHVVRLETCVDFNIRFGPVRTNFYQVVLPTQAQFGHRLNAFARASTENTLMFGTQGFTASFLNHAPVAGFGVWFKPEFLRVGDVSPRFLREFPFFKAGAFPFLPLTAAQVAELVELYERITYEYENGHPYRFDIIRSYLTILLLRAKHLYEQYFPATGPATGSSRAAQLTQIFQELVAERIGQQRHVAFYAAELCVSAKHLSDSVKQVTGRSAQQHIAAQLLLEAKVLLLQSGLSVAEVAHRLHFHDPAHFGKFFKALTGQTPAAFRLIP